MYIVLDTTGNSVLTLKEDLMASGSTGLELSTYHHQVSPVIENSHDKKWQIKR